jgi:hypothetical protein
MAGAFESDAAPLYSTANELPHPSLLDQINEQRAKDAVPAPPAATYNVAPAANNAGQLAPRHDPYYHGTTPGGRAGFGVSGALVAGGAGLSPNKPGGEPLQNFQQLKKDYQVDPTQPYARNPIGAQTNAHGATAGRLVGAPETSNTDRILTAISKRGQYIDPYTPVGGLIGALAAPTFHKGLTIGADALVTNTKPGTIGNALGSYWQNNYNFDPTKLDAADLIKPADDITQANIDFARLVQTQRQLATTGNTAAQELAKERLNFLERPAINFSTLADIKANQALSAAQPEKSLFSASEIATIENKYRAGLSLQSQERAMLDGLQKVAPKAWWTAAKNGLVGIGLDLAAVNIDRSIAKATGGQRSLAQSYNTEQFLAPAAIALGETIAGKSFIGRAAVLAGSIGVSRLIDGTTQAIGLGAPKGWNAPTGVMNWMDGLGVTAGLAIAATAKVKATWPRLAAVAIGYGLPKIVHAFEEHAANNLVHSYGNLQEQIALDSKRRDYRSLQLVTDTSISLNEKKEDWLLGQLVQNRANMNRNWADMGPEQRLLAFRTDAGMARALGEDLLKRGTRLEKQGEQNHTLAGYEIDLGGRAMQYLLTSKDSAERAAEMTQGIINNNNDPRKSEILVNGTYPTESEIDDLGKFQVDIQKDLAKILDQRHDCQAVLNQVVKDVPPSSDQWLKTYMLPTDKMIELYIPKNAPAQVAETKKVIGKLYRDQAIAYMALAQYKIENGNDGGGALSLLMDNPNNHSDIFPSGRQKRYNGAQGILLMAATFDPDSKDLPELEQMWKALVPRAEQAAGVQMTNPNINILNVDGQAPLPQ